MLSVLCGSMCTEFDLLVEWLLSVSGVVCMHVAGLLSEKRVNSLYLSKVESVHCVSM